MSSDDQDSWVRRRRDSAERDFRREEDVLRFLQLRGLALARELGVDGAQINETIGIVVNALGEEWIRKAAADVPRGGGLPFRRHPIGDLVSTAGATQLVELMELAEYLKTAAHSPAFAALVASLKSDYHSAVLQLAFAHRFARAGATDLTYEPPATDGRFGDLAFTTDGERYVVECYRPHVKGVDMKSCWMLAQQILEVLRDRSLVLGVAVQLNCIPSAENRRELAGVIHDAARRVEEAQRRTADVLCELLCGELATVSVCRSVATPPGTPPLLIRPAAFPRQADDFPIFARESYLSRDGIAHAQTEIGPGPGLSHVGIWLPPEEEDVPTSERELAGPLEKLGRKLEAKLAQARSVEDARRLLVVNTWTAEEFDRVDPQVIARFRGKLLRAHERVAGVFLVRRGWRNPLRGHRFTIRPLRAEDGTGLPAWFIRALLEQEKR